MTRKTNSKRLATIVLAFSCFLPGLYLQAATIVINNINAPGEGFNDLTVVPVLPGNLATTLGQQRLNVAQAAADSWGLVLDSQIDISIDMAMADDGLACDASTATLGLGGATSPIRNFTGAPFANTHYPPALANSLAGEDLNGSAADMELTFNSKIDISDSCLNGTVWWYGIGSPAVDGTIDFFKVVLHEISHGLGMWTYVNTATGAQLDGLPDIFEHFLEDHSEAANWPSLGDSGRQASAIDTGDLHWTGSEVVANSGILSAGVGIDGHPQMYAPGVLELYDSVVHWDTAFSPNELMEPISVSGADDALDLMTHLMLRDIGWSISDSVLAPAPPNIYCSTPGLSIPDPGSVADVLNITASEILTDISVQINASHTWVGDLDITLQHDAGAMITLMDRPDPLVPGNGDCDKDDIKTSLWDAAPSSIEDECNVMPPLPAINGLLMPKDALNAFDMDNLSGAWTLTVTDNVGGDPGTLNKWCISPFTHGECDGGYTSILGNTVGDGELLICNAGFLLSDNTTVNAGATLEINVSGGAAMDGLTVQNGGILQITGQTSP